MGCADTNAGRARLTPEAAPLGSQEETALAAVLGLPIFSSLTSKESAFMAPKVPCSLVTIYPFDLTFYPSASLSMLPDPSTPGPLHPLLRLLVYCAPLLVPSAPSSWDVRALPQDHFLRATPQARPGGLSHRTARQLI